MLRVIDLYYYLNTLLLKHYSLTLTHYNTTLKIKLYKYGIHRQTWIFKPDTDFVFEKFKIVRYLMTLEI